jgi:hypothetical protein
MEDTLLTILSLLAGAGFVSGTAVVILKKILFSAKVINQAVSWMEEHEEGNKEIFRKIMGDPEKKDLAVVLSGAVKRVPGLTDLK